MAFTVIKITDELHRIQGDKGNLIGMITKEEAPSAMWRIELLMKIESRAPTLQLAVAFVKGAEVALRAFRVLKTDEKGEEGKS